MAFQAGAIVSKLTLDRSKFSASIKTVRKQSKNLGGWVKKNSGQFRAMGLAATAAGAAVLLAFKKMVKVYVETGDMIHKMSIRTGFAAETLSELAYAADISGADISMLAKGVKNMAKVLTYAGDELETYIREFRRIGLNYKELLKMKPEEQFFKIAEAIAEVKDQTTKSAAAQVIFGRAGFQLLPLFEEGAEGMKILAEDAHRLGIIFDEEAAAKAAALKDAQTALTGSVKGLSIAILNDLIPVLTNLTKGFTDFFVTSREHAGSWTNAILGFFKIVAKGVEGLGLAWHGLQAIIFKGAEFIVKAIKFQIDAILAPLKLLAKLPGYGAPIKAMLKVVGKHTVDLTAISEGYNEAAEEQIQILTDIIIKYDKFTGALDKISTSLNKAKTGTKGLGEAAKETLPAFTSWATGMGIIFQAVLDNITRTGSDMSGVLEQAVTTMTSDVFEYKKTWQDTMREILAGVRDVAGGLDSVFSQLHENEATKIDNEEKRNVDAIESWYELRRAAIEAHVTDEEEKVAALEALDEEKARKENKLQHKMDKERRKLERKKAKAQKASALISAGINVAEAITKAFTAGPLIGQIFAGIVAALGAVQMAAIAAAPLPALARGGRIGKAGIVGEEGPELFFPRTPGTIVPLRSEATPLGSQPSISIRIMGSLISTTGVARADLERAGNTLFDIIEMQARRRGYTLNGA